MPDIENLVGNQEQALSFADLVRRHGEAEFARDIETTMATVCENPHYTFSPMGWEIKDRAMLREFYEKMLAFVPYLEPAENGSLTVAHGPDHVMMWDRAAQYRWDDGHITRLNFMVSLKRDPESGLVAGEHAYVDEDTATVFTRMVGDDLARRMRAVSGK